VNVSEIFVVLLAVSHVLLHPIDSFLSFSQFALIIGRISENIPENSFASGAYQKGLISRNHRIAFFAIPLTFYQTRMNVFFAYLQKLQLFFVVLNCQKQGINEVVNIFKVQFGMVICVQYLSEEHS